MQGAIDEFLEQLTAEGRSPNTQAAYRADLRGFYSFLQTEYPRVDSWHCVNGLHLAAYVARLQEKDSHPATLSRKAVVLGRFFDFLSKEIPPLESLPPPTQSQPFVPLSPEKMDALLAQMTASTASTARRDRALLALLWETGAQVSEVVRLNLDDFDPTAAEIVLNRGEAGQRTVALSSATVDAVNAYLTHSVYGRTASSAQGPLLRNQRGQRLTRQGVWWILRDLAAAAGIEGTITPRLLRRGAVDRLLQAGVDQQSIHERLGLTKLLTNRGESKIPLILLDGLPPTADNTYQPTNQ